jgi:hypothetical protein
LPAANNPAIDLQPATQQQIAAVLYGLLSVYGVPAGWDDAKSLYLDALADLPFDLLQEAAAAHIRTSQWFPKPAQLRAFASEELSDRRAARAIRAEPPRQLEAAPVKPVTPEEIEAIKAKYRAQPGWEWLSRPRNAHERRTAQAAYVAFGVPDTVLGKPWKASENSSDQSP